MTDLERPADRYWLSHGVYKGQVFGSVFHDDRVIPWYGVASIQPGLRSVVKGEWTVAGSQLTQSPEEASVLFRTLRDSLPQGRLSAVALVALVCHSRPGMEMGECSVVVDTAAMPNIATGAECEALPGMQRLHDLMVSAVRQRAGLDPAVFTRPEPERPFDPAQDVPNSSGTHDHATADPPGGES